MDFALKNARDWLNQSTRRSFYDVIEEAKITPRQMEIAELRFVKNMSLVQIAMKLHVSERTVAREINNAYKAVIRAL